MAIRRWFTKLTRDPRPSVRSPAFFQGLTSVPVLVPPRPTAGCSKSKLNILKGRVTLLGPFTKKFPAAPTA